MFTPSPQALAHPGPQDQFTSVNQILAHRDPDVLGLGDLFTTALPYPMVKLIGTPMLVAAPGYAGYRIGGLLTLAGTAVLAAPVIVGVVLAANGPDAIRIRVMVPCAAVYGFALAVIGVRLAAKVAESTLPEMCQVALRTAT